MRSTTNGTPTMSTHSSSSGHEMFKFLETWTHFTIGEPERAGPELARHEGQMVRILGLEVSKRPKG